MTGKRKTASLKLKLDLSEWDLGDWPKRLEDIFTFDWDGQCKTLQIEANNELLDSAARRIAHEAIEAFFHDFMPDLTDKGIEFYADEEYTQKYLVPWSAIFALLSSRGRDALIKKLQAIAYTIDEDGRECTDDNPIGDLFEAEGEASK